MSVSISTPFGCPSQLLNWPAIRRPVFELNKRGQELAPYRLHLFAANRAHWNRKRREAFEEYGFEKGLEVLARHQPSSPWSFEQQHSCPT